MAWHGLCKKHFEEAYDESKDGYVGAEKLGKCDFEDCDEDAEYELYPDLKGKIEEGATRKSKPYRFKDNEEEK